MFDDGNRALLACSMKIFQWGMFGGALIVASCSPKPMVLMETPVLYCKTGIDPFASLPSHRRTVDTRVFYATVREPHGGSYGNEVSPSLRFGTAAVRLGSPSTKWADLHLASTTEIRAAAIPVSIGSIKEAGSIDAPETHQGEQAWARGIQTALETSSQSEIMIYVHGTKVDFTNSCALTAEVEHFTGRRFVGIGYAWPSHQNIFEYLDRVDLHRAQRASHGLRTLIRFLAENTRAKQINILCYSAGGRVTSKALDELRQEHAGESAGALRRRYRLGAVVFAAADVPVDVFNTRLKSVADLAQQVVVTVSDHDNALISAHRFMGGKVRAGTAAAAPLIDAEAPGNVEIVNLSYGSRERGFDITGHHYWYRHPWASSDIMFLMRKDLPAHRRGLSPADQKGVWSLPADYPHRLTRAVRREWSER